MQPKQKLKSTALRDNTIASYMQNISRKQLVIFGVIVIGVILVSFIASWALLHFGYKLDEKQMEVVVKELEERHQKDNKEAVEK